MFLQKYFSKCSNRGRSFHARSYCSLSLGLLRVDSKSYQQNICSGVSPKIVPLLSPFGSVDCIILLLQTNNLLWLGEGKFLPFCAAYLSDVIFINVSSPFKPIVSAQTWQGDGFSRLMFTIPLLHCYISSMLAFQNIYSISKENIFFLPDCSVEHHLHHPQI